ncbi:MAG: methionine biosynthesis protein MetW [Omnitrophica WOR_2 bacterium GWA2_47_8]|nr:MAG: methionine biosynthesis protein MetW [Omnitrophica WOR_2 bacterium GWA2_47_8]
MLNESPSRIDHKVICDLIEPNSKVLDLGCGDGMLLETLMNYKGIRGTGIEIDEKAIYQCMAKGLTVSHANIDSGLSDYGNKRFDYVILNESLQQVLHPQKVISEACRVGKKVIVGIPNFCHVRARVQIFFRGKVPVTHQLPYEWYDTPNLRFLSLKDFRKFCKKNGIKILKEIGINETGIVGWRPNLLAKAGLYLLEKN